jgi:hypothetical protein
MKHITRVTKFNDVPARASLLETQQKVAVLGSFAAALNSLGQALGTWIGLIPEE